MYYILFLARNFYKNLDFFMPRGQKLPIFPTVHWRTALSTKWLRQTGTAALRVSHFTIMAGGVVEYTQKVVVKHEKIIIAFVTSQCESRNTRTSDRAIFVASTLERIRPCLSWIPTESLYNLLVSHARKREMWNWEYSTDVINFCFNFVKIRKI